MRYMRGQAQNPQPRSVNPHDPPWATTQRQAPINTAFVEDRWSGAVPIHKVAHSQ